MADKRVRKRRLQTISDSGNNNAETSSRPDVSERRTSIRGSLRQAPLSRNRNRRCLVKNRTRGIFTRAFKKSLWSEICEIPKKEFVTVFKVFEDLPSDEELEKYKKLFVQQQENGFIDRAGLSLILEKMGRPMSHAEMRHLINSMDSRRIGRWLDLKFQFKILQTFPTFFQFWQQTKYALLIKIRYIKRVQGGCWGDGIYFLRVWQGQ